ncbi:MAG TPA: DNA polymerase III subunit beta [Candidatus Kaiserbacteria bacterium]|nr:DNA polymerase III subunit beta [Candidatus Kaiserbacteria bacterium]
MRTTCVKDKIRRAVVFTERVTNKNSTLPILSSIIITANKTNLIIKATNLEIGVEIKIQAKVEKEGEVAVPGGLINNTLSNITTNEKIEIESVNNNLVISTKNNSILIKSYPTDDFPIIPRIKKGDGGEFTIKASKLISGIHAVMYSAAISDIKPEIASIYIYQEGKDLIFVATDSSRLAEKKIVNPTINQELEIILPLKTAQEVVRIFEDTVGDVSISFNKNQITLQTEDIYITSRLVNGIFPDYKQIIPKKTNTEAIILKQDLLTTLKLAHVFSDKFNKVDLNIDPANKFFELISKNNNTGEYTTTIKSALNGDSLRVSFNQKYLIDVLNSIKQDSVTLSFAGQNKPLIITGVGDLSFRYLVMPMNS